MREGRKRAVMRRCGVAVALGLSRWGGALAWLLPLGQGLPIRERAPGASGPCRPQPEYLLRPS